MITAKLLIYRETEEDNSLTDFYFNVNEAQGVFIGKNGFISTVISGQIYELEYNEKIFEEVKAILGLKSLGIN